MSQRPFRFIHAADLHLDQPIEGLVEAPGHLADLLIDCPLLAAKRVFDAAIEQQVDFVVLAGDVLDLRHGSPRETLFLIEQFDRLHEKNIAIYWAGGAVDSTNTWSVGFVPPANVRVFSHSHVERCYHKIAGAPVCEIAGRSHDQSTAPKAYELSTSSTDVFSIAVAQANFSGALGDLGVRYWALGGSHQRSTVMESPRCIVHCAGSPQGRRPSETGPHGCTLVEVNDHGQVRLTPIATDVVRWQTPRVSLGVTADRDELERVLRQRTVELLEDSGGVALLVAWTIACNDPLWTELRRGKLAAEITAALQREFGHRTPPAWTIDIEPELPCELPPSWQEEDSLRGDFLRAFVAAALGATGSASALSATTKALAKPVAPEFQNTFLGMLEQNVPAPIAERLDRQTLALAGAADADSRRLLQEVAWLGADLLSPEEAVR